VKHTNAKILDTRKTTPGYRALEKKAVLDGGGVNHRMGLYDRAMVKDNHLVAEGGIAALQEAIRKLNEYFDEAAAYAAARKAGSPVKVDLRLEAMIAHVEGRKSVFFAANDGSQIAQVVDFATRHKLRAVIIGGTDAWRVAPLLAKSNIPVVLRNSHELPNRLDEDYDLPYKTAALLKAAGVSYCLSGALGGFYQIQNLPFQAGTLAAFGLSKEEALASVTLNAAKILGIDSRVGSIEVGKDATLVLSKGDLLDMRTSIVTTALIAGRNVDLSNKHKALYNRFQQKYGEK
jgi:imidazolonepropionase-like amidohydrolase